MFSVLHTCLGFVNNFAILPHTIWYLLGTMPLFTYRFWIMQCFLVTERRSFCLLKLPLLSLVNLIIKRLCSDRTSHFFPQKFSNELSAFHSSSGSQSLIKSATSNLSVLHWCADPMAAVTWSSITWGITGQSPPPSCSWWAAASGGVESGQSSNPGLLIGTWKLAADQWQPAPST